MSWEKGENIQHPQTTAKLRYNRQLYSRARRSGFRSEISCICTSCRSPLRTAECFLCPALSNKNKKGGFFLHCILKTSCPISCNLETWLIYLDQKDQKSCKIIIISRMFSFRYVGSSIFWNYAMVSIAIKCSSHVVIDVPYKLKQVNQTLNTRAYSLQCACFVFDEQVVTAVLLQY